MIDDRWTMDRALVVIAYLVVAHVTQVGILQQKDLAAPWSKGVGVLLLKNNNNGISVTKVSPEFEGEYFPNEEGELNL
jgi:hypothetical protein